MNVSKDVVLDLLPLYVCGEASADSRRLVEAHLARDPELAAQVRGLGSGRDSPLPVVALPAALTDDVRALAATRRLLRRRSWAFGLGAFFTLLPFSVIVGGDGHLRWLWSRAPYGAVAAAAIAGVLWMLYARTQRRLRGSGV